MRHQIQHASTAFAAVCSRYEQKYHHAKLEKTAAECETAQAQLQFQLAEAQSCSHKQQQLLQVLQLVEQACQQDINKLQMSLRGQQVFCLHCNLPMTPSNCSVYSCRYLRIFFDLGSKIVNRSLKMAECNCYVQIRSLLSAKSTSG